MGTAATKAGNFQMSIISRLEFHRIGETHGERGCNCKEEFGNGNKSEWRNSNFNSFQENKGNVAGNWEFPQNTVQNVEFDRIGNIQGGGNKSLILLSLNKLE